MRRISTVFCALLLAACNTVEDTAVPPADLPDYERGARLVAAWSGHVGSAFTRKWIEMKPVVDGDTIFAANIDGTVSAIDRDSGRARWETGLDTWLSAGVGIDGEQVYVGTAEGDIVALGREDGSEAWRHQARGELLAAPASNGALVIARTVDGRLLALSARDGDVRWTYASDVPPLSLRGNSSPLPVPGGILVGLDNGRIAALESEAGRVIWETEVAPAQGRSPIERIVDIDGSIGVGRSAIYASTYQGKIAQIDPNRGDILWSRELSSYAGLNVDGRRVYVTDADSHVNALDVASGAVLWRQEKLDHRQLTAPVPIPGTDYLAIGDFQGFVHLLARGDGRIVARRRVDDFGIIAAPVATGERTFVVQTRGAGLVALEVGELN